VTERPDPLAPPDWYREDYREQPVVTPPADPIQQMLDRHVGRGPKWMNGERNDEPGCDVQTGGSRMCGKPGGWWAWIGCVNEHVDRSQACDEHIEGVEHTQWVCQKCGEKGGKIVYAHVIKKERWTSDDDRQPGDATAPGVHRQPHQMP
jgi:hypothetical protein